ncbi:3-(3-hydroxy-phenyl)propionate hydroxylase/6-hydroxy-3-succinoylpyridine 3-monooxygenase [Bradyrhizobium macuxiense]|uniref:3-(3-hydroxy-phenyl)propionate hydroxylase/6-hydroxy-3-succinoylpyridine 3-monooxygenase n=1 Tax=Bradyrhizobium macuxiense TaxID=1755647 RepID=A0A560KWZ2_9BRAD|nr:FAD-dependent monooxygenase [Bradyrhizobium macuxiense]TWB87758.1 3-(3-hydroxy-phenyl)propionate hydroxylase/6-hydroxy-3-succinoylpyridine 3-monooxygenase [Bradyrhizobium macuxiense]
MTCAETVTIVGAGPVGLIAALGLAKSGVSVTVLERANGIIESPRAITYHWSCLEGLSELGLLDDALRVGFSKQDYSYIEFATGERIDFSLDVLEGLTKFPYNLHLGQHRLAEIALRKLAACPNVTVHWGVDVTDVKQNAEGVSVDAIGPDGKVEFRSGWLVGADGAGSTVRSKIGLEFDGITWPKRFVAANLRLDFAKYGFARTTFLIDSTYGAIIVKLDQKDLWRCTYSEDLNLPEESIPERLRKFLEVIVPAAKDDYALDAYSPYRMHQRAASTFRVGRVLLAGDAAHATNPSGGYGLVGGLFDVYALYKALAAVVQGRAGDETLDRYAEDRRRVFLEIVSPAASETKRMIFDTSDPVQRAADMAKIRSLATDRATLVDRLLLTSRMSSEPVTLSRTSPQRETI